MHLPTWRYSLWLLLVCLVAGTPIMFALHYRSHRPLPPVWPIPDDPTAARKAQMINLLYPIIHQHNKHLLDQRKHLLTLRARSGAGALPQTDQAWLKSLAQTYKIALPDADAFTPTWIDALLRRVDIIPADLALAQAASESAWGSSRFALQGNNYFGIWCFTAGCGLVPLQRPDGASYEVQYFASITDSVDAYMLNINSHDSYKALRELRANLRDERQPVTGKTLSNGLMHYSAIGSDYITQLKRLMRHNDLKRFNRLGKPITATPPDNTVSAD